MEEFWINLNSAAVIHCVGSTKAKIDMSKSIDWIKNLSLSIIIYLNTFVFKVIYAIIAVMQYKYSFTIIFYFQVMAFINIDVLNLNILLILISAFVQMLQFSDRLKIVNKWIIH